MIVVKFNNANFYHLAGLHKTKIDTFFPTYLKTQDNFSRQPQSRKIILCNTSR